MSASQESVGIPRLRMWYLARRAASLLDCPSPPPSTPLTEVVARHHETGVLWRRRRSGGEWLLDLDDGATRGYMLGRVREAWGIDVDSPLRLLVSDYGSGCCIEVGAWGEPIRFELDAVSLAEALVAALEASP